MPAFSRRAFLVIAAALSCGLSACSQSPQTTSAQTETHVVTDVEGTQVTVPTNPQRVVTLSEPTLDSALALGVKPVGTISGRGQSTVAPYLLDKAADIPILGTVSELNFEAIAAAKPDLILVDGTSVNNNPPVIETLRNIAPVVYTGYAGGDWRKNLDFVAKAVNKESESAQVVADYDARVESLRTRLKDYANSTFSVIRWQGNSPALILKELPAGRTLEDLGLKRPAAQDRMGRGHSEPVSLENLQDIDADFIFFGTLGGSSVNQPDAGGNADASAGQAAIDAATQVPGFTDLKAYKEGHIIPVDGAAWTSTGGPLLINHLLDDVEKNLL